MADDYKQEAISIVTDVLVLSAGQFATRNDAERLVANALQEAYRKGWVESGNEARRLLVPPYHIPDHFVEWAGEVDKFLGELKRQQ